MTSATVLLAVIASLLGVAVAVLAWLLVRIARGAQERERQARAEVLALLNHEIRTPLHGWLALVELMEGIATDARQRQYLSLLRRSAHQLDRLTADVLAASQTGDWTPDPSPPAARPAVEAPAGPPALPQGCRILFADDVELNRLVLREFLAGSGAQVDEAEDGAGALRAVEAAPYDLIILDLRMPVMDGFAAARAIRAREQRLGGRPVPLVALSAGTGPEDRQQAKDAGFTLFLAKPIDRTALLSSLAGLLPAASSVPRPNIPEGLEHMLPLFVAEMDKDSATLRTLADGPAEALAEHAHAMRGKCGMFGEEVLFELLTRLEDDANAERRGEWSPLIAGIVARADQLKAYAPTH